MTIDELRRTVSDLEGRLKSEISRLKKKYESEHHEFEIQIDGLGRANAELNKTNKSLATRLKVNVFPLAMHLSGCLPVCSCPSLCVSLSIADRCSAYYAEPYHDITSLNTT